jgi:CRISPR-associated endonuclease/helicase Cas3
MQVRNDMEDTRRRGVPQNLRYLWAKTGEGSDRWHPLILHLLDVAASADAIMSREPASTRARMGAVLGLSWEEARPWILLIVACHDLGKASPGFQFKWPRLLERTGLRLPRIADTSINHAFVSQLDLRRCLQRLGWSNDLAKLVADASGCHHGQRASPTTLDHLQGNKRAVGDEEWSEARAQLFKALLGVLQPGNPPTKDTLAGPDFMLLSGLVSFADWIGSSESHFPFGSPEDCDDLESWFARRSEAAQVALDSIGWLHREPIAHELRPFEVAFGFVPRPLQSAMEVALSTIEQPSLILVEAPMGEGKTEAAFFAHLELQRRFGHRGLYIALPTKATGNAMFTRTLAFLKEQLSGRSLDLQLLHGSTALNDEFLLLRVHGIYDPIAGGSIRAGEWFTHKKRALLSEYGVGTVDQAIVPILPVRHNFVRLWGLANRVVVFDEIHAYDAYTGTLLLHLVRWLIALGSSVIMLSATLPPAVRRRVAGLFDVQLSEPEAPYPRISIFSYGRLQQRNFPSDPARRLTLRLDAVEPDLAAVKAAADVHLMRCGTMLILLNTVQRAQDLYSLIPSGERLVENGVCVGKRLADDTEVLLFHARYPAEQRQRREDHAVKVFGAKSQRHGRKILIATQVAEQSLDLDFDVIITDLAPIDLLLQRAGRLWRHKRAARSVSEPVLVVAGLAGEQPPSFGRPLWWEKVYREDILLRTWCLLKSRETLSLPDEIDSLVDHVYDELAEVPEPLQERLSRAVVEGDGNAVAHRSQANQAIIGVPDDGSWNDPARFVLYDEDQPGVHRTLLARTRLGEDSVICIPILANESFEPDATPDLAQAKAWYRRAISVSRKGVVNKLRASAVPAGWQKSSLLRNAHPLVLSESLQWVEDPGVSLDDELGLVYEAKEIQ